jgi:hypothetical protein
MLVKDLSWHKKQQHLKYHDEEFHHHFDFQYRVMFLG